VTRHSDDPPDDSSRMATAQIACEQLVKDQLKSPSTAKFTGVYTQTSGSTFVTTGSVDAQNSFGATIRADFRCETPTGAGSTALVSLTQR